MNKLLLIPIMLILFLSACSEQSGTPIKPNENNMIITIKNKSNFDFNGLGATVLNHSSNMTNADGSKIKKGEELRFEFLKEDFDLDGEAEMEVQILKDNGDTIPLNKKVTLQLVDNQELFFELTGNSVEETEVIRVK